MTYTYICTKYAEKKQYYLVHTQRKLDNIKNFTCEVQESKQMRVKVGNKKGGKAGWWWKGKGGAAGVNTVE